MKYNRLSAYLKNNNIEYKSDYPSSNLVTFKIGGIVDMVVYPCHKDQFIQILRILKEDGLKYVILGNGSNSYFSDKGYDGVVISTKLLNKISKKDTYLIVECGVAMEKCAEYACDNGLTGLEFAYGIPGNIGGCVYMNASAFNKDMADVVYKSVVYDSKKDEIKEITLHEHKYGMKHSVFMENRDLVILETILYLTFGDVSDIKSEMISNFKKRRASQPLNFPSAGSVFKRPINGFASKMIEDAGLKGTCVGDAMVSDLHAGFIINMGSAKSSNVKSLIEIIKQKVKDLYGILLEEEIIFIE